MKKILKIIGLSILLLILFRGFFYKFLINYSDIGTRTEIKITNEDLINRIEIESINKGIELEEILEIADKITNESLSFTTRKTSNDPNELIITKKANCIGYSAMFNSITNYLIRKNKLEYKIEAKHKIGQLDFLGVNLHQFFDNSFFKDHDFNEITNKETGKVISLDPSVSDYLNIKSVNRR